MAWVLSAHFADLWTSGCAFHPGYGVGRECSSDSGTTLLGGTVVTLFSELDWATRQLVLPSESVESSQPNFSRFITCFAPLSSRDDRWIRSEWALREESRHLQLKRSLSVETTLAVYEVNTVTENGCCRTSMREPRIHGRDRSRLTLPRILPCRRP
jgi:hypothetical protein